MKKVTLILVIAVCQWAFSQTIKITAGADLLNINYQISSSDPLDPLEDDLLQVQTPSKFGGLDTAKSGSSLLTIPLRTASVDLSDTSNKTGVYLGLVSEIPLSDALHVKPEVRAVLVKDFSQIQVPVLLSFRIAEGFNALVGPNLGFLLNSGEGLKSFNFAMDLGLSYSFSDALSIDARYDWGLANLLEEGDAKNYLKINNIQIGVAYWFGK